MCLKMIMCVVGAIMILNLWWHFILILLDTDGHDA